jgi:flagellar biosynthesis protein FlhF
MALIRLHRFRGETSDDARKLACRTLGPETRIHAERTVKKKGLRGLFGASQIEVLASRQGVRKRRTKVDLYEARRRFMRRLSEVTDPVRNIFDGVNSLTRLYRHLVNVGVSEPLAEGLMHSVRRSLPPDRMREFALVKQQLRSLVLGAIRTSGGLEGGKGPGSLFFVGPTGVGKTTTIAKLAANLRIFHHRDIALVTTDTFRVGAYDQLKAYAEAIDVPLHVAQSGAELTEKVQKLSEDHLVLVDTAGASKAETVWIGLIGRCVKRLERCATYLLLDAGAHSTNQAQVLRRFSPLRIDNLILTKTDENIVHGQVLDILIYTGLPVAYVTTGQNVPGDIARADEEELADLILGKGFEDL